MAKISIREVKQALKDPKFRQSLPPELQPDLQKYSQDPSCPCNLPIYNKILKFAVKQLKEYYPDKEEVEAPDETFLMQNNWLVINCHVDELENQLKRMAPGRKQLAIARHLDQVTVVVNELQF